MGNIPTSLLGVKEGTFQHVVNIVVTRWNWNKSSRQNRTVDRNDSLPWSRRDSYETGDLFLFHDGVFFIYILRHDKGVTVQLV